ncbi:ABC transporter substrate-binding protein [Microbacterium sp. CPCC 204701]|uniref:ABC transporter substrate-binding protein n=1 Tax=Microbacterium sp. CPCC 204701 TaxID=2493084 RepID=UPI000FD8E628|nr:extracellular solute-binding protein [Microbacterium sp. CPCC 204701]
MTVRHLVRGTILGSVALVVALAGCASGGTTTAPGGDEKAGSESDPAALSGEFTLYGPGAPELEATVIKAFNEEYPNIRVNAVKLVGQDLPTRLQSEFASGQHVGDVVLTSTLDPYGPWGDGKQDWWEPYLPEGSDELPAYAVSEEQGWFAPYSSGFGIAYNTEALSANDVPKTWDELLDPKWKGRVLLPDPTILALPTVLFSGLSLEGVIDDEWVADFVANEPIITESAAAITQPLSTGVGDLAVWGQGYVTVGVAQGAPFAYIGATTAQSVTPAALIKDGPNPEMAKVFLDWLLTDPAQESLAQNGYIPLMPDQPLPEGITPEELADSVVIPTFSEGAFAEAQRLMGVFESELN